MSCKKLNAELVKEEVYDWEVLSEAEFDAQIQWQNFFNVCFCVEYRPVWLSEWILDRWRWNDRWEWTEDWIFNDWDI